MKVRVIGVGNLLMGDDGFGVHVLRELERAGVPGHVEMVEAGTMGLGLLDFLEKESKVVLVDCAEMGLPAGAVRRVDLRDLPAAGGNESVSLHEAGVAEVVLLAEKLGVMPREMVIFGIQPGRVGWGMDLSPPCAGVLGETVNLVLAEIQG